MPSETQVCVTEILKLQAYNEMKIVIENQKLFLPVILLFSISGTHVQEHMCIRLHAECEAYCRFHRQSEREKP